LTIPILGGKTPRWPEMRAIANKNRQHHIGSLFFLRGWRPNLLKSNHICLALATLGRRTQSHPSQEKKENYTKWRGFKPLKGNSLYSRCLGYSKLLNLRSSLSSLTLTSIVSHRYRHELVYWLWLRCNEHESWRCESLIVFLKNQRSRAYPSFHHDAQALKVHPAPINHVKKMHQITIVSPSFTSHISNFDALLTMKQFFDSSSLCPSPKPLKIFLRPCKHGLSKRHILPFDILVMKQWDRSWEHSSWCQIFKHPVDLVHIHITPGKPLPSESQIQTESSS